MKTLERPKPIHTVVLKQKNQEPQSDVVSLLKDFLLIKEQEKEVEKRIEEYFKPLIEAARNGQDEAKFIGKFRGKLGEFIIKHIESKGKRTISIGTAEEALKKGIINAEAFEFLVKTGEASFQNRVRFDPGTSQ